mgnify:CR=1 FL=1
MNRKSNWEYKQKKKDKRRSKQEIKKSPQVSREESMKIMNEGLSKFEINFKCQQSNQKNKVSPKQLEQKQLEQKQLEQKQLKKTDIITRFSQDALFRKKFLQVIRHESNGEYGSTNVDSYESLEKPDRIWFDHLFGVIERKIEKFDENEENPPQTIRNSYEIEDLVCQLTNNEQKREKLIRMIDRSDRLDTKKELDQKDQVEGEIRKIKRKLHKVSLEFLRKPHNLKNDSRKYLDSTEILLDANAIIHSIVDYEITHKIKTLCPYETLVVYLPNFVKNEINILCEKNFNKEELRIDKFIPEIKSIYKSKIKDIKYEPNIDGLEIKKVIDSHPNLDRGPPLSAVDAKCLLYAKSKNLLLITNDQLLKHACKQEHVKCVDHNSLDLFHETINSNYEDWFVGKISRMRGYWKNINEFKTTRPSEYIIRRNAFRIMFQKSFFQTWIYKIFLLKIYFDGDSLPEKTVKFFELLPEKSDLTLDDIENVLNQIAN